MLNATETRILRNVARRLRGANASDDVVAALRGPARLYLETWILPALDILAREGRSTSDLRLADDLSRVPPSAEEPKGARCAGVDVMTGAGCSGFVPEGTGSDYCAACIRADAEG